MAMPAVANAVVTSAIMPAIIVHWVTIKQDGEITFDYCVRDISHQAEHLMKHY